MGAPSGSPVGGDGGPSSFVPGRDRVSRDAALTFYAAVAAAQEALESNVNLQLALDAMLLRMHAAFAGQRSS